MFEKLKEVGYADCEEGPMGVEASGTHGDYSRRVFIEGRLRSVGFILGSLGSH